MDGFEYDLETMETWELQSIQNDINREIWRRYNTDHKLDRSELIDAHNEIETELFIRRDTDRWES